MFFRRRTGNEQVIDVGITEGKPTKDLVNEPLEGLCCVAQAKRHSSEFKQPKGRSDSCFGDVGGLHWDLDQIMSPVPTVEGAASYGHSTVNFCNTRCSLIRSGPH